MFTCTLSKEQSIVSKETIQNAILFSELCPFKRLRLFILYQSLHSRASAPTCGALVLYLEAYESNLTCAAYKFIKSGIKRQRVLFLRVHGEYVHTIQL